MPEAKITAIICTHNRQEYLGLAIDSLLKQDCSDFDILVVDNQSSDDTAKIVKSRLSDARLRYVYEPTLGLSVARNRGFGETSAPILAYLDDDAIASVSWLRVLLAAYQEDQRLAIAGGKVTLIYPPNVTTPTWLSEELSAGLGLYDLGDEKVYIQEARLTPRGLNYSIRRSFLEEVGGFDLKLGRIGTRLLSNEELYMTELAISKEWRVAYLPDAWVAHHVAPERLQASWFLRRSWWQGISEHYREVIAGRAGIAQLGRGSERIIRGLYKSVKYFRDPAVRFDNLVYAYGQLGYLGAVIKELGKND